MHNFVFVLARAYRHIIMHSAILSTLTGDRAVANLYIFLKIS